MSVIKAVVRQGRIEVDDPLDLPDGTVLAITIPDSFMSLGLTDNAELDTPESIGAWMKWLDELEPIELTDQERAAWDQARAQDKQHELSNWNSRSGRVEGLFQ